MTNWEVLNKDKNKSVLVRLLENRGIKTEDEKERFLNPLDSNFLDPFLFLDMEKVIKRIDFAVKNHEKILIWGDFDSDGVTSTSILYKIFEKLNADFIYHIPHRIKEGHGLNSKVLIPYLKEKIKLVITVDCGISNNKEIDLLKSFKVDTIVVDHHKQENEKPNAIGIINANANDTIKDEANVSDITSLTYLCGAGASFKLYLALLTIYPELKEIYDEVLILSAIGTISDVVPLLGENRIIVSHGLKLINEKKHYGVSLLMDEASRGENIKSMDIAFTLTPRINAAGRLQDASLPFELLVSKNHTNFKMIIQKLNNLNNIRQKMCEETFKSAEEQMKKGEFKGKKAIVLFDKEWHIGIIGIVASKVAEKYNKPAFLMTIGENNDIRCSIRGAFGYNIYDIISQIKDYLVTGGGHEMAGGFSFDKTEHSFDEMKNLILKTTDEMYGDIEIPSYCCDIEVDVNDIDENLIEEISYLEPFGEKNPLPVFKMGDVIYNNHQFMGKNNEHLRVDIKKDDKVFKCVMWQRNTFDIPNSKFDIAFYPFINEFNGEKSIQFELKKTSLDEKNEVPLKIYDHRAKENILSDVNKYLLQNDAFVFAKKNINNKKT